MTLRALQRKKEECTQQLQAILSENDPAVISAVRDLLDGLAEECSRTIEDLKDAWLRESRTFRSTRQQGYQEAVERAQTYAEELAATNEELRLANEELNQANEALNQQNADLVAAQKAAEEERQRYYDLFDAAPEGYLVTDRSGTILEANHAAAVLLAVHKESLAGRNLIHFVADRKEFRSRGARAAGGEPQQDFELDLRPLDGRLVRVSASVVSVRPEDATEPPLRWMVRDITERVQAEEALKDYAERLRRSNEDLERFAYVSSHDLQEPLRTIVTFTQLLERKYRDRLDTNADEYIDYIVAAGKRMQTLINDLLEFSRISTQGADLRPTDARAAVENALQALRAKVQESGAAITVNSLPPVIADATQLQQVFLNLISNAIKFKKSDAPPRIHIAAKEQDSMVQFSVADNGIGIDPQYREKIFVIFQRLHGMDRYEGTGIGLAIVKRIVERHKGRIWVESEPGQGSTFHFTLPAAKDNT